MSNHYVILVNTVKEIREGFTQLQYEGAKKAQWALAIVGYPSEKEFKNMVRAGMITN